MQNAYMLLSSTVPSHKFPYIQITTRTTWCTVVRITLPHTGKDMLTLLAPLLICPHEE